MRTRSKRTIKVAKPSKSASSNTTSTPAKAPLERLEVPSPLLIIPKTLSKDVRILSLSHSGSQGLSKFCFCPENGLYEFAKIETSRDDYRTLLVAPNPVEQNSQHAQLKLQESESSCPSTGFIVPSPTVYTTSPFDPLFLLLPALVESQTKSFNASLFRAASDIFDYITDELSPHFSVLLAHITTYETLIKRLEAVCDSVQAGDESMYRLSHQKLLEELLRKARKMVERGIPGSLEERFVRRVLEVPMMGAKREPITVSDTKTQGEEAPRIAGAESEDIQSDAPSAETAESQESTSSSTTITSSASDETTLTTPDVSFAASNHQPEPFTTPPSIPPLLRLRLALHSLFPFLPLSLPPIILALLSTTFAPLTAHLSALATLRAELQALRSMNNDISRKRPLDGEDEEKAEERREKKRKKEEEDKRKKEMSRGVKALGKVDVTGMKKMGDFFKKKAG